MGELIVAIDNGSQSTKVTVFDGSGGVIASAQRALRPSVLAAGGRVQHPDDDVWDSIRAACSEVMRALGERRSEVVAVGLCTIRFCRAYLDDDGELTEPLLSWMDERVSRPVADLNPQTRWITTSSGYISHRVTGRFADTAGNYQGVWPIDHETWRWATDSRAFDRTGMSRGMLFDLVNPGDLLGQVTPAASAATGLPEGIDVFATSNDKAVEALGSGLRGPDTALLSLGTYIAAMTVGDRPVELGTAGWRNFGARPGQYLFESGGIRRGMWTVSWFRDLLGDGSTDVDLGRAAAEAPIGSGGLMTILDWLAPDDAPFRRGVMVGFDGTQGRGAMYRSILEGIALTMRGHLLTLTGALGRVPGELVVSGGGSRSDVMLGIVADVFDMPVRRTAFPDAAGLGAAISAAVGIGLHADWDAAVDAMVHTATQIEPTADGTAAYAAIFAKYAQLPRYTDPLLQMLASDGAPDAPAHAAGR